MQASSSPFSKLHTTNSPQQVAMVQSCLRDGRICEIGGTVDWGEGSRRECPTVAVHHSRPGQAQAGFSRHASALLGQECRVQAYSSSVHCFLASGALTSTRTIVVLRCLGCIPGARCRHGRVRQTGSLPASGASKRSECAGRSRKERCVQGFASLQQRHACASRSRSTPPSLSLIHI